MEKEGVGRCTGLSRQEGLHFLGEHIARIRYWRKGVPAAVGGEHFLQLRQHPGVCFNRVWRLSRTWPGSVMGKRKRLAVQAVTAAMAT